MNFFSPKKVTIFARHIKNENFGAANGFDSRVFGR